ncbi:MULTISPECIES: mechanosensitive ion channel family protein [unclassified Bacillus (in: firmicutes)]|uniref:mechanosensitive ion channel family protein n=1 Tax=unclassified Bacillus (in: firmicutes) TaxID=185979 RepID=UPI0008EDA7A6|nr:MULTISPECIES: mechanosensitive ion channel family protein [unclassified Bacillus (in: firmicutes)]SFB01774.1 small conductance mechanosensitive channel [Bacillus sp. UNCCL13]SFQ89254.1 small conductance mechanosensitive channel [Bacillus sp. cl95]
MGSIESVIHKLGEKFLNEDTWVAIGESLIKIIVILILAGIMIRIGKLMIHNIFKVRSKSPLRTSERRENTMMRLLDNVLSYVVYFIAFMMILSAMTIDVKALLAGAGILGLAVGFGAQSLVKDVITGFFIIFEDQFSVGDFIRIGQFEGNVEEIGLRTTKIKNWTGEVHIFPNGSIVEVTNFSLHNSMAVVDVGISYEGDIEKAERVIKEFLETLPEKYEEIVKTPELLGIQSFGPSEVVLRIVAETLPMRHFFISRMIRREIKVCMDEHGIEIPYPRIVMYSRQGENQANEPKKLGSE